MCELYRFRSRDKITTFDLAWRAALPLASSDCNRNRRVAEGMEARGFTVSATGLVTGLVKGASAIRATTEGVTGTLVISVSFPPRPNDVILDSGMQERE